MAEVQIGPFRIPIWDHDSPIAADDPLGEWNPEEKSISVRSSLGGTTRWTVLVHELVHAISDLYDLDIDGEHICSTLANGIVQALRPVLPEPPRARPPVPQFLGEDDDTPDVQIEPITRAEQMPK